MSANTTASNDPRKLADEMLNEVTGGLGMWNQYFEDYWTDMFKTLPESITSNYGGFEDFLLDVLESSPDSVTCRNAWISAGKPSDYRYYIGPDGVMERRPDSRR